MTGIVCDKFLGNLYLFADGRLTDDAGYVFSDTDDKIRRIDTDVLATNCGDSHLLDSCESLYLDNKLDQENLNHIHGDGTVLIMTVEEIKTIDFCVKNEDIDGKETVYEAKVSTYKHAVCPLFLGSGTECLTGAYLALEIKNCKTEKEYLSKMKKVYKAAAARMSSMGPLRQIEIIKINKDA